MQHVDVETRIVRKIFFWTMVYAVAFGLAVLVILRDN